MKHDNDQKLIPVTDEKQNSVANEKSQESRSTRSELWLDLRFYLEDALDVSINLGVNPWEIYLSEKLCNKKMRISLFLSLLAFSAGVGLLSPFQWFYRASLEVAHLSVYLGLYLGFLKVKNCFLMHTFVIAVAGIANFFLYNPLINLLFKHPTIIQTAGVGALTYLLPLLIQAAFLYVFANKSLINVDHYRPSPNTKAVMLLMLTVLSAAITFPFSKSTGAWRGVIAGWEVLLSGLMSMGYVSLRRKLESLDNSRYLNSSNPSGNSEDEKSSCCSRNFEWSTCFEFIFATAIPALMAVYSHKLDQYNWPTIWFVSASTFMVSFMLLNSPIPLAVLKAGCSATEACCSLFSKCKSNTASPPSESSALLQANGQSAPNTSVAP